MMPDPVRFPTCPILRLLINKHIAYFIVTIIANIMYLLLTVELASSLLLAYIRYSFLPHYSVHVNRNNYSYHAQAENLNYSKHGAQKFYHKTFSGEIWQLH